MTAAPQDAELGQRAAGGQRDAHRVCGFCRRALGDEYHFTCLKCDASFCYIHMARHQPAACSRQLARRRVPPARAEAKRVIVASQGSGTSYSANV
jgi:hypothetical protein